MKASVIALIIVVLIALGGFGLWLLTDNDDGTPGSSNTPSTSNQTDDTTPQTSTENIPSTGDEVEIEDFAFSPATITVKKGATVTWTNKDSTAHTVTSESGGPLSSELLEKGEAYSFTFNEIGTFDYFCTPHPQMKGKVVVTE